MVLAVVSTLLTAVVCVSPISFANTNIYLAAYMHISPLLCLGNGFYF